MFRTLTFLVLISFPVYPGWTSGGGDLFLDSENPWFPATVANVNYCVEVSEDFGVEQRLAKGMVKEALAYWKQEFKAAVGNNDPVAAVGVQSFRELEECDSSVSIKFQLGGLSAEQLSWIQNQGKDRRDIVGITVRTDYNLESMEGKGFVYISPDTGIHSFRKNHDRPVWSVGTLGNLHKVLVHELGHVFGISHSHDDGYSNVTSAHYVKAVVEGLVRDSSNKAVIAGVVQNRDFSQSFLQYLEVGYRDYLHSACAKEAAQFYGLTDQQGVMLVFLQKIQDRRTISVARHSEIFGTIRLKNELVVDSILLNKFHFTPQQKIFAHPGWYGGFFAPGASVTKTTYTGTYVNLATSLEREVLFTLGPKYSDSEIYAVDGSGFSPCVTSPSFKSL